MKVLEVIPITRDIFAPKTLSYFSMESAARGDLVKISLRGKDVFAIVEKTSEVAQVKAALKKNTFKLKPIKAVVREGFFSEDWFGILEKLSKYLAIPQHAILSSLLPKALLSKEFQFPKFDCGAPEVELRMHKKYAIKGSFEDRTDYLRGVVREHFARKKSLIILSPSIENLLKLRAELGRGIEEYIFCFSSKLSAKKYLSEYNKAIAKEHPILILGTPQILFIDRPDTETLVIEEEGSRLWRDKGFFSLDFRRTAELIAETKKYKLFFSDQILKIETIYKSEAGQIEAKNTLAGRIRSSVETRVLEVKKTDLPAEAGKFSWISGDLAQEIEKSLSEGERVLLFVNRKGYSSFTICQDCSRPQLCHNCSIPLVLHKTQGAREFICHHCLKTQAVSERCQSCGSWKLKDFGLGVEKVIEEFRSLFPKANPDNVNVATEAIFSRPQSLFDLVAIISLDNLFTIPDFRINESIFRLVSELKSRAKKKFILQTRLGANKLIQDAASGNISGFYQDELEARRNLDYPPFVTLIKLSYENRNLLLLKKEEEKALSILKNYGPISFPAFREKIRGRYRWNILLKIADGPPARLPDGQAGGWPDDKLRVLLENLSPMWQVSVDPESII